MYDRYGSPDVLELRDVIVPFPADDEVRVRVHAASVNPLDWHSLRGKPYLARLELGLTSPKRGVLGADLAGVVDAVGKNVSALTPGDEVYGNGIGALADYVVASETWLAPKPANLSFEQAAALPVAGLTALQGLCNRGGIRAGQHVLINGASGGVGTIAVQIAASYGAEVTGVCSTGNIDLVRSLGATHTVDYSDEDFTAASQRYDLILDAVGNRTVSEMRRALTRDGTLVLIGPGRGNWIGPIIPMFVAATMSRLVTQKMLWFLSQRSQQDLLTLKELTESGELAPVIDRTYPLDRATEAITYLEAGRARGKVVLTA